MSEIISRDDLRQCVAAWLAGGKRVAGPRQATHNRVLYEAIATAADLLLEPNPRPANSIKEFFFPRHQKLYRYQIAGRDIQLLEAAEPLPEQIVVGCRPCDAAALPILDHVFNWDTRDQQYNAMREATTIVTIACSAHDDECFCTSVGLSPSSGRGSDVLLFPFGDGTYQVDAITEKGKALFAGRTSSSDRTAPAHSGPQIRMDPAGVKTFACEHFDDPFWREHALACVGCGVCAYTCPTCHCFDIVDEGNSRGGYRARNWDSCQYSAFTQHASGHNPRPSQAERQRQRVYHKFHIYPEKFHEVLCTGCGNCSRNCPAGLGILSLATEISHG